MQVVLAKEFGWVWKGLDRRKESECSWRHLDGQFTKALVD